MIRISCFLLLLALLLSCSKPQQPEDISALSSVSQTHAYVSLEDFSAIEQYGVLRLIAPRFDGAEALPRSGISVLEYQKLAEAFALANNLRVDWVFVDGFSALLPALIEGKGDVVVTNMAVTPARSELAQFTTPIAQVSEVLVSKKPRKFHELDDLKGSEITLPEGTAYIDTLHKLDLASAVNIVSSDTSDSDLLSALSDGEIQATVIDSDIARTLLPIYPDLAIDFAVKKYRPIAWAVRKNNNDLLYRLNEFLVSHHVKEDAIVNEKRNWDRITASGKLRMLTLNNPASYFMWRGELMGFEYDLVKKFAEDNDLYLSVIVKNSIPELISALLAGEGDLVAASLTATSERERAGISFTRPYLKVREQLVGRDGGAKITSLDELQGHSLGLNPATVFYSRFLELSDNGKKFDVIAVEGASTESLIEKMLAGEYDFTVADSHLVAIENSYHEDVNVNLDAADEAPLSWGVRSDQPVLKRRLDDFIKHQYKGLFYNVVFNKYFKSEKKIKRYQGGRLYAGSSLSPFDDVVKKYAQASNMDWRLIVSQMYQESKFNPTAQSFAGAVGLMQVMPRTGRELGYGELHVPENGVAAGVAYMRWLAERFPGELDFQERLYFTLAAYNAGTGHVRDARKLAKQLGLDANKWFGNVEKAMLKLALPKYYENARFGYVRGKEPVEYVRSIRDRYLAYLETQ